MPRTSRKGALVTLTLLFVVTQHFTDGRLCVSELEPTHLAELWEEFVVHLSNLLRRERFVMGHIQHLAAKSALQSSASIRLKIRDAEWYGGGCMRVSVSAQ